MTESDPEPNISRIDIPQCGGLLQRCYLLSFWREAEAAKKPASIQNDSGLPQGPLGASETS
jgi:hypothetical protein